MYKNVVIVNPGIIDDGNSYYVAGGGQLRSLVEADIPINRLQFGTKYVPWFFEVVTEHPDYFSKIRKLAFVGFLASFLKFYSVCLIANLVTSRLVEPALPDPLLLYSSKLTDMTLKVYDKRFLKRTPYLKSLEFFNCDLTSAVLPPTLQELTIDLSEGVQFWGKFPPALKKLTIGEGVINLSGYYFPEGLFELDVAHVDFRQFGGEDVRWPSSLKKLIMGCGRFAPLRSNFPSGPEILSLCIENWDSVGAIPFPQHLQELTLHSETGNDFDITGFKFPSTLEYLDIRFSSMDCSKFPEGLKVLKIETSDSLSMFPTNLEHLRCYFMNNDRQHLRFRFPSTLRILELECSSYCTFELNLDLPDLEYMELSNCCGPAPSSVKTLKLMANYSGSPFDSFVVPFGVTELEVSHSLKKYPDSFIDLKIENFVPRRSPPFPKNLRYLYLDGAYDVNNRMGLKLPPSLFSLDGRFNEQEREEIHWRFRDAVNLTRDASYRCVI